MRGIVLLCCSLLFIILAGCSQETGQKLVSSEIGHYPLDGMEGIITQTGAEFDASVSSDGHGSLKIVSSGPMTVNLLEIHDLDVEDARLLYQAKVRTQDAEGPVYLEMWVHLPDKGEFFTRNVHTPASGTTGWMTMEAPFFLQKGQKPDYAKLNIVLNGKGTVWIDDIRLVRAPLPKG